MPAAVELAGLGCASPARRSGESLYVVRKYGAEHPDVVDVITEKDGVCYLYVIQSAELDGDLTLSLQKKLNNYLAYILDGQMEREYPSKARLRKVVRIELKHPVAGIAAEFLAKIGPAFQQEGVGFEYDMQSRATDV